MSSPSALHLRACSLGLGSGAAIWTSVIAKDSFVNKIHVEHGNALGMVISAGPALYLTWVAFALTALAIVPYCASCLTCEYARRCPFLAPGD